MSNKEKLLNLIENSYYSLVTQTALIDYLNRLEDESLFLEALEANGVDNWTWYSEAKNDYINWKNKNIDLEEL